MPTQPRKSRVPIEADESDRDFIWDASSSSEEDWGDGAWEVDGITEEHINTRGEIRYKVICPTLEFFGRSIYLQFKQVAWGGWQRDDDSNCTWENEDGTTMQDLSTQLRQWRKNQDAKIIQEAQSPLVPPFTPSIPFEEQADDDVNAKPKSRRVLARYLFTELANQARQMAIDLKDKTEFEQTSPLESAALHLQEVREKRASALKSLESTLSEAPSQCLYGLGPAPQKEGRYKAQKKLSLHHHMKSLHVSTHASKSRMSTISSAPSEAARPVPLMKTSDLRIASTETIETAKTRPKYLDVSISSRSIRSLPRHQSPISQSQPAKDPLHIVFATKPASSASTGSSSTVKSTNDQSSLSNSKRNRKIPSTSSFAYKVITSDDQDPSAVTAKSKSLSPRAALEANWSAVIHAAGAATVTFVNNVNDEEIPPLDVDAFKYLESGYIFASGVTPPQDAFMESCDCPAGCMASLCSCQDDSEIQDDDTEAKQFAYDARGLFTFSESITSYVIECNKNCLCSARCQSRVAQRPRRFPIEVFRTERCGWGVRSTVALQRGTVLGVYTGELIPREIAKSFSTKRASYVFDLDFMNSGSQSGYSVDAYNCGSWTRFVNHSCSPVCALYSVIWDSVPSLHQPKLAFVTNTDVPARQELTIDYCPQARKGKGKARLKFPGTPDCMCDAEHCRGFIYLR